MYRLWIELCFPSNSHVEVLNPKMTIFGNRALKELMKVIYTPKGGALIHRTGVLLRRDDKDVSVSVCVEKRPVGAQ